MSPVAEHTQKLQPRTSGVLACNTESVGMKDFWSCDKVTDSHLKGVENFYSQLFL